MVNFFFLFFIVSNNIYFPRGKFLKRAYLKISASKKISFKMKKKSLKQKKNSLSPKIILRWPGKISLIKKEKNELDNFFNQGKKKI